MHSYYVITSVNGTMSQRLGAALGALEQTSAQRTRHGGRRSSSCPLSGGFANLLLACWPCLEHLPLPFGGLSHLGDETGIIGTGGGESIRLFCSPNHLMVPPELDHGGTVFKAGLK